MIESIRRLAAYPSVTRSVLAAATGVVMLVSAWHGALPTWRQLDTRYDIYAGYTPLQRSEAPATKAGFVGDLFDVFSSHLARGDRIYFQVPRRRYGTLNLHDTFAALGRYFFLPAVEVAAPADATIVVSYHADPRRLGRPIVSEVDWGDNHLARLSNP